ncbi:MAG: hypothetical protein GXZ03_08130 [Proteiniphilum sp.]|nr:hypothetical protein [Proteiniphilum sp.]
MKGLGVYMKHTMDLSELEWNFEGLLTAAYEPDRKGINVPEVMKYCRDRNIEPKDLSDEEVEMFINN